MWYFSLFVIPIFFLLCAQKIRGLILKNLFIASINVLVSYIVYWTPYWVSKSDKTGYAAFEFAGILIIYVQLILTSLVYYLIYKLLIWWAYKK